MKRRPYRHLLVPTDGSAAAARGVKTAVALAAALGARLRALYVAPARAGLLEGAGALHGANLVIEHLERQSLAEAQRALGKVQAAALKAGARCSVETAQHDQPWRAMLRVARRRKCDLIVLASSRRGALERFLRGSQTARVLARSRIAVLLLP